uniref:Uncharacterized protein n=1 Tax=viral metagenome TaxID=1070528 RepID=A0A6M3IY70_9ZZZZ
MKYQRKQIRVYQDGEYRYTTDNNAGNRPWFGKTWTVATPRPGEIAAAHVWDRDDGGTSRWHISA